MQLSLPPGAESIRSRILILLIQLFGVSTFSHAQTLWPGMEAYVSLTFISHMTNGAPEIDLINRYTSPLVAVEWDYACPGVTMGVTRHSGKMDAAMTLSRPYAPGQKMHMAGSWAGCSGGVTVIVFADGKELGDPIALQQFHECRAVAKDEIHRVVTNDVLTHQPSDWDIDHTIRTLKARRATFQFPMKTPAQRQQVSRHAAQGNSIL